MKQQSVGRFSVITAARVFAFGLIVLQFASAAAADELKVMSFNVRFSRAGASEEKTENNWNDKKHPRRERAVRVIKEYAPDVFGVQEAREGQIVDLIEDLPEYEFYGVGRDDGKTGGEYTGIYYLRDKFDRIDEGSFWLSDNPEKPGTSFYKVFNAVPRMASWVRLVDKQSEASFLVLNTHWDHISKEARRKSAALILDRLQQIRGGMPTIVMGDLNGPEKSPEVRTLLNGEPKLLDSYRVLNPTASPNEGSFGGWRGATDGHRIDFILYTDDLKPLEAEIVRTSYEGLWPSDHYPVTATLELAAPKK